MQIMSSNELDLLHAARTEDLEDSQIMKLMVFGDFEQEIVTKLSLAGAHLLQGARGIGKSMLMKATEVRLDNSFNNDRILAVYVNFKTSTLLEGVKAGNNDAFQIWVGAKILQATYEKLVELDLISSTTVTDPFKRIFNVVGSQGLKETLQEKIHLLQQLSQKGDHREIITKLGKEFIIKVNDITYINSIIRDIIKEYKIERLIFLFDEAAHTFIPKQQEIFFEIFKLLHGGKVAVKAAVYPSITSYGKNFEVGQDAIQIELGRFEPGFVGRLNTRKLFRNLLNNRIPNNKQLKKEIFSSGELLDNCIDLSSGNPRAFLHLFNRVHEKGFSERSLLLATQEFVDEELLPYHNGLSKRLPKYAHHVKIGLKLLRDYIIPEIKKKNLREKKTKYQSAFFTIERGVSPNLKLSLDLLCYSGILTRQGTIKIASRQTGQRYMVHLALLYTEKAFITNKFNAIMRMISLTDYREFSSNDPSIDEYLNALKSTNEDCSNCNMELPTDAKFCPSCGTKVEEKSIIGALLEDSIDEMSISKKIAKRILVKFKTVGDVIHSTREELMTIKYIKEVRSKYIKNAADEYISG